jgi:hypothetical protein
MFRIAPYLVALLVVSAVPAAFAATSVASVGSATWSNPDEPYGHILNTDGGTFDGVALHAAVQDSREAAIMTDSTLASVALKDTDALDAQ